jgi:hypothetical protein
MGNLDSTVFLCYFPQKFLDSPTECTTFGSMSINTARAVGGGAPPPEEEVVASWLLRRRGASSVGRKNACVRVDEG